MQSGMVALTEAAQRHAGPGEDGFAAYAKLRTGWSIRETASARRAVRTTAERSGVRLRETSGRSSTRGLQRAFREIPRSQRHRAPARRSGRVDAGTAARAGIRVSRRHAHSCAV
jgi:hypothetical protein